MAKAEDVRAFFDSLELAIASWGKWSQEPWRVAAARQALDRLVEAWGQPITFHQDVGATPYLVNGSRQYVSVTWSGGARFNVQSGFMQARMQIDQAWLSSDRGVPDDWFVKSFPNHERFGGGSEQTVVRSAECCNGCSPGEKHPIGSLCPYCEDEIVRRYD